MTYVAASLILGLTAGFSPGPLLTLVVSETLRFSKTEGIKVALAPLITDIPIVVVCIALIAQLQHQTYVIAAISTLGALFLCWLAYDTFRASPVGAAGNPLNRDASLRRGIVANLLNPHPYIFWLGVGGPMVVSAYTQSLGMAATFVGVFYACLVGAKIILAVAVDRAGQMVSPTYHRYALRFMSVGLVIFAALLLRDALMRFVGG